MDTFTGYLPNLRAGANIDIQSFQELCRRMRHALRKRRQDPICAFHKRNTNILGRIDLIQTIGNDRSCRLVQFRRKFGAGCACANNRNMELARLDGLLLRMRTKACIDNFPVEACRLVRRLQHDGMLSDARRTKIVGHAAHCDHEGIVGKGALRRNLLTIVVKRRRKMNFAIFPVNAYHFPEAKSEVVPVSVHKIVYLMLSYVHAARGNFMKQRLPQMRAGTLDQRNRCLASSSKAVAEAGRQFESPRSAPYNDNMVEIAIA